MSVAETLLVYVAAPLAVVLLLAAFIYLPAGRKRARYRPGQPWEHEAVWYEPHPEHAPAQGHGETHGEPKAIGSSVYPERPAISGDSHGAMNGSSHGATAGASAGGATAAGAAGASSPVKAGPLGGARGTW